jgi:hypothetical protein
MITRDDVVKTFDQHTYDLRRELIEVTDRFDMLKQQAFELRAAVEVDQRRAAIDTETIAVQAERIKALEAQVTALYLDLQEAEQKLMAARASQR